MRFLIKLSAFFFFFILSHHKTYSQTSLEFWFWPKNTLGQKAENYPGPRIDAPVSKFNIIKSESVPIVFHGEEPTERIIDFVESVQLPKDQFSVEMAEEVISKTSPLHARGSVQKHTAVIIILTLQSMTKN